MVDGPGDGHFAGLRSIDLRMIWQALSSIVIVAGTAFGAFILSCKFQDTHYSWVILMLSRLHPNCWSRLQKRRLLNIFITHIGQLLDRNFRMVAFQGRECAIMGATAISWKSFEQSCLQCATAC